MSIVLTSNNYEQQDVPWLTPDDFETYLETNAIIVGIASLGLQDNPMYGTKSNRIAFKFNVETEKGIKEYWKEYTASINEKSNLGKMLRKIRGRDFTPEELRAFSLDKVLGANLFMEFSKYTSKSGREGVTLDNVKPAKKKISPIEEPFIFDIDDPTRANFDRLPKYMRERIEPTEVQTQSPNLTDGQSNRAQGSSQATNTNVEEIPF